MTEKSRNVSSAFSIIALLFCSYPLVSCSLNQGITQGAPSAGIEARFKSAAKESSKTGSPAELIKIQREAPESAWAARSAFLQGLARMQKLKRPVIADVDARGASASASTLFTQAMPLASIRDHVEFNRALALYLELEFARSAEAFEAFLKSQPDSVLLAKAKYHLAASIEATGDLSKARTAYDDFIIAYPKDVLVPDALLKSAILSIAVDDVANAAKTAARIIVKYPSHDAARPIERLIAENKGVADLISNSIEENFERGENLLTAARYADSAAQFAALKATDDLKTAQRAAMRLAAVYMRARLYNDAESTLTALIKTKLSSDKEPDALYTLAAAYMRQGKFDKLIETEKTIAKKYPDSKERGQTMLLLGRAYEEKSDFDSAAAVYKNAKELIAAQQFAEEIAWRGAWLAYRQGMFDAAYKTLSTFTGAKEEAKFAYWSGRSAAKAGLADASAKHYEAVIRLASPKNNPQETVEATYYAKLAQELMPGVEKKNEAEGSALELPAAPVTPTTNSSPVAPAALNGKSLIAQNSIAAASSIEVSATVQNQIAPTDANNGNSPVTQNNNTASAPVNTTPAAIKPSDAFLNDRHYAAAKEFDLLGLNTEAAAELAVLSDRYATDRGALLELATMFYTSGNLSLGLKCYRRFTNSGGATGANSYDAIALAYPPQAVELVRNCTGSQKVDPRLVAAVMREESAFNPTIISRAGALGLMQIMPATGAQIARSLKDNGYEDKNLLVPDKSIRYGAWYIEKLLRRFDNNIVLAIAAYNAGPTAVAGWIKILPTANDEFIEAIPYGETRNYTKKVLTSYSGFLRQTGEEPISIMNVGRNTTTAQSAVAEEGVDF